MEKVRTLGGIIDKPVITFPTTVPYPWDQTPVNIAYEIMREVDKTEIPTFKKVLFQVIVNDVYSDYTHIYTDGSKDPLMGKVGLPFVVDRGCQLSKIISLKNT